VSSFYFSADDLVACRSQGDLASLFRVSLSRFRFHLYSDLRPKYRLFEIPKTSGGFRTIHAPPTLLKYWQELLLHGIESKYSPKPSVHGFIADRSVLTNARMHIKKHIVLNLDLLDFFSSIHFGRVRGLFQSHPFNLNWEVASTLAQMCTYEGVLPQGAPTSPVISNFVCRNLDRELWRLAARGFCSYSRYADDITFSTNQKTLPSSILEASMPMDGVPRLGSDLTTILEKNGFSANLAKTRVQSSAERQMVTGLIVNNRANLPRKFAREIRAIFFNVKTSGYVAAEDRFHKILQSRKSRFSTPPLHASLQGKLSYLRMIRGRSDPLCSSLEITGSKLVRQLPPAVLRGDSTRIPAFHEEALTC
jgi:RNA-directed DNA polymerase